MLYDGILLYHSQNFKTELFGTDDSLTWRTLCRVPRCLTTRIPMRGSSCTPRTSHRHKISILNQQVFETPDEELATQRCVVRNHSVENPAGVYEQQPISRYSIVLVLNTLVENLQRRGFHCVQERDSSYRH